MIYFRPSCFGWEGGGGGGGGLFVCFFVALFLFFYNNLIQLKATEGHNNTKHLDLEEAWD